MIKNIRKKLKRLTCSILGHTYPICPNHCTGHGFCYRCGMFYDEKTDKWYCDWRDSITKKQEASR